MLWNDLGIAVGWAGWVLIAVTVLVVWGAVIAGLWTLFHFAGLADRRDRATVPDTRAAGRDHDEQAAEQAAREARIAAQLAERDENRRAREAARAARNGPGHEAARQALAEIAERARQRRYSAGGSN
jgi:biopolymer transport protein ExbB/TolQ